MVKELYAGNGAVRKTLHKYVVARWGADISLLS
jgi:hypothetical protein